MRREGSSAAPKRGHNISFLASAHDCETDLLPTIPSPQTPPPEPDQSALWKRCHSQFTDVDDYRRHGRNTWHDETGVYANSDVRSTVIKPTNTIPERLA